MAYCVSEAKFGFRSRLKILATSFQTGRKLDEKPLYSSTALPLWHISEKEPMSRSPAAGSIASLDL